MGVTARPATADDANAIARAHLRAWQHAYRGVIPAAHLDALDVDERTAHWHQNLTEAVLPNGTPSPENFVAEIADQVVVGFACVGVWRNDSENTELGELWAMYVDPDHWGTGAGHALMEATFDHFANQQVRTGYLWVLEANPRARRFYERQGWQADDVTDEDHIGGAHIVERRYSISL